MKRQKVISEFGKFVSIQSVSADPKRFDDILTASDYLAYKLKSLGFSVQKISKNKAPPLVVARINSQNPNAKTIAIYGHYDVQPEDPLTEWKTPPFKLTLKNGRFFGRGVSDNKGPVIQNIAAIENLIESGNLNNHIIFLIEGEEESGGGNFEKFALSAKKELSKADCFFVTDAEMYDKTTPHIFYGLRGLIYFELTLQTGKNDFHSGSYGNLVINPAQILSELFSDMKCMNTGKINIPGFYNDVRKPTSNESQLLKSGWNSDTLLKDSKAYAIFPCNKTQPWLSSKIYPSMDINGIVSGYAGKGAKTIIPCFASAKFSFRLVDNQSPAKIEKLVRAYIKKKIPQGVKYDLKTLSASSPFYTSLKNPFIKNTSSALEKYFGRKTLFNRNGASIPAAEVLQRLFHRPVIITGFVNPDNNIHAPNERLDEACFWKGIGALERVYSEVFK
jgi:acetylornithine deacetylase/succinyl-diaminopimelate desuccinylase-like protein